MNLRIVEIKFKVFLLLCMAVFISCNSELEEEITWNLDDHPDMLVVQGQVTNTPERQSLYLTVTGPYLSTENPKTVSGALITVNDGDNTYTYSESNTNKGLYMSDSVFKGEQLKTYFLSINLENPLNGISEYSAYSMMPEGHELDSIMSEIYFMPDFGFDFGDEEEPDTTLLVISYYGKEPDDPENYYLARITANQVPWQINAKELLRFSDDVNNGSQSDFILFIKNVLPGDTISLELVSVDKKYYDYIGNIQLMDQSGNAYSMSGPPANAIGNIPGALGFFPAVYISEKTSIAVDRR